MSAVPPPPPEGMRPQMQPGAQQTSPDGKYRWNGTAWVPNRKMFLGDYANQSIASAIIGLLCAPFFLFGFYAGYKAYKELPHKQTLAIVGLVLNAVGAAIWIVGLAYRVATA